MERKTSSGVSPLCARAIMAIASAPVVGACPAPGAGVSRRSNAQSTYATATTMHAVASAANCSPRRRSGSWAYITATVGRAQNGTEAEQDRGGEANREDIDGRVRPPPGPQCAEQDRG